MVDTIFVGLIVAAAAAFVVYRYFIKKSGGCSCGTCRCPGGGNASKSCCPK
ncbi:FeoB-associated Cys-rich membrane protein [Desulfovibrio sp. OttesenSCG-928-O18]|nr:FeoB-associated Cys-rich membrane protein [Desulfovibrio sp. OttesenSCG-928-O18]